MNYTQKRKGLDLRKGILLNEKMKKPWLWILHLLAYFYYKSTWCEYAIKIFILSPIHQIILLWVNALCVWLEGWGDNWWVKCTPHETRGFNRCLLGPEQMFQWVQTLKTHTYTHTNGLVQTQSHLTSCVVAASCPSRVATLSRATRSLSRTWQMEQKHMQDKSTYTGNLQKLNRGFYLDYLFFYHFD